ncbi:thermonuclease family protein [Allopusillimonas soli]|nr:thermonuclease family protein [Allopusillimonas soli]
MNNFLNSLSRQLVRALMARRWGRVAAVAVVLAIAAYAGLFPALNADAQAERQDASPTQPGFSLTGSVVHVADGDTFTLLVNGRRERIRMASIDAPETTKDADRPGQPYAQASRKALSDLLAGRTLTLQCYERDRYERSICNVPLPDGSTANRRQVEAGMAWANMEKQGRFMRDESLPELENKARGQKLGIWRDQAPVRPWEWRYRCWQKQQC